MAYTDYSAIELYSLRRFHPLGILYIRGMRLSDPTVVVRMAFIEAKKRVKKMITRDRVSIYFVRVFEGL